MSHGSHVTHALFATARQVPCITLLKMSLACHMTWHILAFLCTHYHWVHVLTCKWGNATGGGFSQRQNLTAKLSGWIFLEKTPTCYLAPLTSNGTAHLALTLYNILHTEWLPVQDLSKDQEICHDIDFLTKHCTHYILSQLSHRNLHNYNVQYQFYCRSFWRNVAAEKMFMLFGCSCMHTHMCIQWTQTNVFIGNLDCHAVMHTKG